MNSSLPETFLERLENFVPQEKLHSVLDAFAKERAITFRANTLKTSSEKLSDELRDLGFDIEQILWYKDAFVLKNKSKEELMSTNVYKEGYLYIQNLSSMIPPLALSPEENETILDIAASPGSKTTQIACLMQNTGSIVANDKSQKRIFRLLANLKEQGATNVTTTTLPGEFMWKKFPEYFDKVLVDAPCSMEGRFNLLDPDTYKDWSPRKVKELSNLQKWLLRSAVSCCKVDGTIVYSTCAMSPEENEEVIDWILKKLGNIITLEEIDIPNLTTDAGLTTWKNKTFSPELAKTIRIYPDGVMEGFFVAKFKKTKSTIM